MAMLNNQRVMENPHLKWMMRTGGTPPWIGNFQMENHGVLTRKPCDFNGFFPPKKGHRRPEPEPTSHRRVPGMSQPRFSVKISLLAL